MIEMVRGFLITNDSSIIIIDMTGIILLFLIVAEVTTFTLLSEYEYLNAFLICHPFTFGNPCGSYEYQRDWYIGAHM